MATLDQALTGLLAPALRGSAVRHGFFTREGGVSRGIYASLNLGAGSADEAAAVASNKARVEAALGVEQGALVLMHQTHSAEVLCIDAPPPSRPKVDGIVTKVPGIALGVLTADCAPVLFADHSAGVIGAAHAGWRGALCGVLEATLSAMVRLGAAPETTVAAIGPTIAQASYEVGPEFAAPIVARSPFAAKLLRPSSRAGHQLFDLPAYVARRLHDAGVATVDDLALDTYADEARFFSYRRATHQGEADYGRLVSAIVLVG